MPEENNCIPSTLFFLSVPSIFTLINFLGTYLGYAYMQAAGVNFSHEKNSSAFANATNQTESEYHPICETAHTDWVNPDGFAAIAAMSTATTFLVFVAGTIIISLAFDKRDALKNNLQKGAKFAVGMNIFVPIFVPSAASFIIKYFCFSLMDAIRLAGATFLGAATFMIAITLTIACGKATQSCCESGKSATETTPTRVIEVQSQQSRRVSDASSQQGVLNTSNLSQQQHSSALFSPIKSPEVQPMHQPITKPLQAESEKITRSPGPPGHVRIPTQTYMENDGP